MDPIEYLRGIKRRWRLIAVIVAGAMLLGVAAGVAIPDNSTNPTYKATTKLVNNLPSVAGSSSTGRSSAPSRQSGTGPTTTDLESASSLVTLGSVATIAAKTLSFTGDVKRLTQVVHAEVSRQTGFLEITARSRDPERAKKIATAFANALIKYITDGETRENAAIVVSLQVQIDRVKREIANLDRQIAHYPAAAAPAAGNGTRGGTGGGGGVGGGSQVSPADPLIEQRNAALRQLGQFSQQIEEAKARKPDASGLRVIEQPIAVQVPDSGLSSFLRFPRGVAIATILGLFGAIGLALIRERFDVRIRSKAGAEEHFGLPVLAEIPNVRARRFRGKRRIRWLSHASPRAADAFRLLCAAVNATSRRNGDSAGGRTTSQVILVSGAGPDEGTTTVVAELATAFAEQGKTVLVLSCNFRSPEIHSLFGVPNDRGLADVILSSNAGSMLDSCIWATTVRGVYLVPSGSVTASANELLASSQLRRALVEARHRSNVVLLDTSPVLTSEMTYLLPGVDAVLVVSRSGKTSPQIAAKSGALLRQLGVPVMGVALNGVGEAGLPGRYYRPDEKVSRRAVRYVAYGFRVLGWVARSLVRLLVGAAGVVRHPERALRFIRSLPGGARAGLRRVWSRIRGRMRPPTSGPGGSQPRLTSTLMPAPSEPAPTITLDVPPVGSPGAPVGASASEVDGHNGEGNGRGRSKKGRRGFPRLSRRP